MRDIEIDVTMDDEQVYRYMATHVPSVGDTITGIFGEAKGHYVVIGVDHLIATNIRKEKYCGLVTLDVRLSED